MEYFVFLNDERKGPYSLKELEDKYITSDMLVWHEGMTDWKKAGEVEELKNIVKQMPPEPPHLKRFIKNWLTESVAMTGVCVVISYIPMFQLCILATPFSGIAIFKSLKVQEYQRKGQQDMARQYATEARKWLIWGLTAAGVAVIFSLIGVTLLALLGFFLWEKSILPTP